LKLVFLACAVLASSGFTAVPTVAQTVQKEHIVTSLPQHDGAPEIAFDHVAIYVADADRSVKFYHDVFGLRQVPAPVSFARWLKFENGTMIHIVAGRPAPVTNERWDRVAFTCKNMAAFIARLDAMGVPWSDLRGRASAQVGIRGSQVSQIFVQDPDGYWIEVNDAPE